MAKDKAKSAAAVKSTPAATDKQQAASDGSSKTRANVLQFLETLDDEDEDDDDDDDDEADVKPHAAAADPKPAADAAADAKNKRLDSRKVHDLLDQFTKDTETRRNQRPIGPADAARRLDHRSGRRAAHARRHVQVRARAARSAARPAGRRHRGAGGRRAQQQRQRWCQRWGRGDADAGRVHRQGGADEFQPVAAEDAGPRGGHDRTADPRARARDSAHCGECGEVAFASEDVSAAIAEFDGLASAVGDVGSLPVGYDAAFGAVTSIVHLLAKSGGAPEAPESPEAHDEQVGEPAVVYLAAQPFCVDYTDVLKVGGDSTGTDYRKVGFAVMLVDNAAKTRNVTFSQLLPVSAWQLPSPATTTTNTATATTTEANNDELQSVADDEDSKRIMNAECLMESLVLATKIVACEYISSLPTKPI
ncbi:hypothetical protein AYI69_g10073 [Smittium culicis]|uniref:Uncharacterized protein n=1 Tax=Smittium culicis TaxID=133412 RepID=A0A1R1X895_9FUNG|nr:hypothetical protein AYI69_g10073 [Smittium culicis]